MANIIFSLVFEDVSNRFPVGGSDKDWQRWLPHLPWVIAHWLAVELVGKAEDARKGVFCIRWRRHEFFFADRKSNDSVTHAASYNARLQDNWDAATAAAFEADRVAMVGGKEGRERIEAKIVLAEKYGLNTIVYTWKL